MGEAFTWGFIAASSLLLGCLLALRRPIGLRPLGLIMAFGAGVLISAVAYELVEDAFGSAGGSGAVGLGLFAGAFTFYVGDLAIDHFGGERRKSAAGGQDTGSGLAILLGTVLDGIPESIVLGLSLLGGGGVSIAMLAAVFLSNLPEALSSTAGLSKGGWGRQRILGALGVGHRGERALLASRLCLLRRSFWGDDRLRPVIRGRRALDHAGRHHDAGGIQVWGQAGWAHDHLGVRPGLLHHHDRVKGPNFRERGQYRKLSFQETLILGSSVNGGRSPVPSH